jgi:hypothetical protein
MALAIRGKSPPNLSIHGPPFLDDGWSSFPMSVRGRKLAPQYTWGPAAIWVQQSACLLATREQAMSKEHMAGRRTAGS